MSPEHSAIALIASGAPLADTLTQLATQIAAREPGRSCLFLWPAAGMPGLGLGLGLASAGLTPEHQAALMALRQCGPADDLASAALAERLDTLARQFGLHDSTVVPLHSPLHVRLGWCALYAQQPSASALPPASADDVLLAALALASATTQHQITTEHDSIALAIEGSGTGIWDRNVVTGDIVYSRGWKRNLGYQDDEISNRIEDSVDRLHPDDRAYVTQAMADHFAGRTPVYAVEHRIRCKDGHYIWIASRGKVVSRDASGRALRMTGTSTDISAVKALTNQLQQSIDLITGLTDQVPGVVFQYRHERDGSGRYTYTSAGLAAIYEMTPDQLASDKDAIDARLHPDDLAAYHTSLLASATSLTPWQLEFRVLLPQQGLRWREGNALPRRLADGATLWHGVVTDITERKRIEAQLQASALHDFLTGLPNRRHFMQAMADESARLVRQRGAGAAVLMFDLDHFKAINDVHGHAGGDLVLRHFATVLQAELREVDSAGRIGGEEFAALLGATGVAPARQVAQRIQARLAASPCTLNGQAVPVTVSVGIAAMTADQPDGERALAAADAAMYRAKQAGRNRIEVPAGP